MAASALPGANAAPIEWGSKGPFEVCIEDALNKWLTEKAELVVNEDASVRSLDDAAVAAWTVETLRLCAARGGVANPGSEDRFGNYMARWRDHIYDLATSIRQKGGSD